MKALVIGATGATGKPLVLNLLNDSFFDEVIVFVRKDLNLTHEKLTTHIVSFDTMQHWSDLIKGDVVFSCLGTTIKTAKTKSNQWRVDYEYQYNFAKYAKENGCSKYVLVSAYGASSKSKLFYSQLKGKLEDAVLALNYKTTILFQPGILIRKDSDRSMENLSISFIRFLNKLGIYKSYKPLATEKLAVAMVLASKEKENGIYVYTLDAIEKTWPHK